MLKIIGIIALVLALGIAGVLIYAATKPDVFRVQRSATINAPPEKVFPLINDFRQWTAWSPWEKKDPAMKRAYSGADAGKGAVYAWEGDKNVGQGSMEILDTSPPNKVTLDLRFVRPFEARNTVDFTLAPQGNATNVTWAMNGRIPYFVKIVHIFLNMDRMVGGDFETGLANLKAAAEKQAASQ